MLFSSFLAFSQEDSADNSKYFDESTSFSEGQSLYKVNLATLINGDIAFFWEKVLSNSFSIEAGAGLLLPYYSFELADAMFQREDYEEPYHVDEVGSGFSLWFQAKYYPKKLAPEANYWGLQYRLRNYFINNETVSYHDIAFNYGFQMMFRNNFILDYTLGVGARIKNSMENDNITGGIITPFQLKLSYKF